MSFSFVFDCIFHWNPMNVAVLFCFKSNRKPKFYNIFFVSIKTVLLDSFGLNIHFWREKKNKRKTQRSACLLKIDNENEITNTKIVIFDLTCVVCVFQRFLSICICIQSHDFKRKTNIWLAPSGYRIILIISCNCSAQIQRTAAKEERETRRPRVKRSYCSATSSKWNE